MIPRSARLHSQNTIERDSANDINCPFGSVLTEHRLREHCIQLLKNRALAGNAIPGERVHEVLSAVPYFTGGTGMFNE